jgi:hypothetical protein
MFLGIARFRGLGLLLSMFVICDQYASYLLSHGLGAGIAPSFVGIFLT